MRLGALALLVVLGGLVGCTSLLDLKVPPNVDRDSDGRLDTQDNCPDIPNPDQSDYDNNGIGDACDVCTTGSTDDLDHDGIPDGCDGCISNGLDDDHDGIPDNCDACVGNGQDVDHDGIPDNCDACVASGVDRDHDGKDDACDDCVGTGQDIDGDKIDDGCDPCVGKESDTNGDGMVDTCDNCVATGLDSDGDGIDDGCDACMNTYKDADGDGIDDGCDPCVASGKDTDNDGVDDACDPCIGGPQHDEDGDGRYDACDDCKAVPDAGPAPNPGIDDALGPACDLEPAQPDIEIFDAFIDQNPQWFVQGAGWSLQNDQMRYLGGDVSYRMWGALTPPFAVSTKGFVSGAAGFTPGSYTVFVADSAPALQPSAPRLECSVVIDPQGPGLFAAQLVLKVYDTDPKAPSYTGTHNLLSTNNEVTLLMAANGASFTCSTAGFSFPAVAVTTSPKEWMGGLAASVIPVGFAFYDIITHQ